MKRVFLTIFLTFAAAAAFSQTKVPAKDSTVKNSAVKDSFIIVRMPLALYNNISGYLHELGQQMDANMEQTMQLSQQLLQLSQQARANSQSLQSIKEVFDHHATLDTAHMH